MSRVRVFSQGGPAPTSNRTPPDRRGSRPTWVPQAWLQGSRSGAVVALTLLSHTVAAAAPPTSSGSGRTPAPVGVTQTLRTAITLQNTDLTRPEIARATAEELGTQLRVGPVPDTAERYLMIRVSGTEATVEFHAPEGASVGRSVTLPEDHDRALETIALLAANLVRNEADELLEELARKAEAARRSAELAAEEGAATTPPEAAEKPSEPPAPKTAAPVPAEAPKKTQAASPKTAPPLIDSDFNASLWHPVALYRDSHLRRIHLELGLGYSRVGAIEGLGVTVGATLMHRGFRGLVATGVGSWASGDSDGLAASGLFVGGTGRFRGVQASGLAAVQLGATGTSIRDNWAGGATFQGAQFGGFLNYVGGSVTGIQATAANIATGPVEGAQLGAVNLSGGAIQGLQGGAVNIDWYKKAEKRNTSAGGQIGAANVGCGGLEGAQIGVANVIVGALQGAQVAVVNVVGSTSRGAQVGLVNLSGDQKGTQVGLVNVAGAHTGMQLGLINVSRHSEGAFWGLASFADNIDTSISAYTSTLSMANLGIKSATAWYFTRTALGFQPAFASQHAEQPALRAAFAVGSHIVLDRVWFLDPAIEYSLMGESQDFHASQRHLLGPEVSVGYKPSERIGVLLGAGARLEGNDSWKPVPEGFFGLELL